MSNLFKKCVSGETVYENDIWLLGILWHENSSVESGEFIAAMTFNDLMFVPIDKDFDVSCLGIDAEIIVSKTFVSSLNA